MPVLQARGHAQGAQFKARLKGINFDVADSNLWNVVKRVYMTYLEPFSQIPGATHSSVYLSSGIDTLYNARVL